MTTTTRLNIIHLDPDDTAALYCHYSGQYERQDCFIALDLETGRMWANYNLEIGDAVPVSVWHGRTRRFTIPCMSAADANALLDEIASDAQAVLDGADIEWDGNNHVGVLDADATAAAERIENELDPGEYSTEFVVYDAEEYFAEAEAANDVTTAEEHEITGDTTDERLREIADQEISDAAGIDWVLVGAFDYLKGLRDGIRTSDHDVEDV